MKGYMHAKAEACLEEEFWNDRQNRAPHLTDQDIALVNVEIINRHLRVLVWQYGIAKSSWSINMSEQNGEMLACVDAWRALLLLGKQQVEKLTDSKLRAEAWNEIFQSSGSIIPIPEEAKPDLEKLSADGWAQGQYVLSRVIDLRYKFYPDETSSAA